MKRTAVSAFSLVLLLLVAANCTTTRTVPDPVAGLKVPPIAYKTRKLANGLTVYSLHDASTSNVAVAMYYEVGSKHDPEGRAGFAHLFEHLLSRKTVNIPYNTINKLVEDVGGSRNATTTIDRTRYFEIVPAQYLETLWTHAERMGRAVLDAAVLDSERMAVNQEYEEFTVTPPYAQLYREVIPENVFERAPHRRPTIGRMSDLANATIDDARAFHEAFYGPDTALLTVSGNFDQAQLDVWVDKYFASIPPRPRPVPLTVDAAEPPQTSRVSSRPTFRTSRSPRSRQAGGSPRSRIPTCRRSSSPTRSSRVAATRASTARQTLRRARSRREAPGKRSARRTT